MFQSVSLDKATILQSGEDKMYCRNCGMNLPKFYKTSHTVKLKDNTYRQYCSIYCLAEEMEFTVLRGKKDTIKNILVVDVSTNKYIDAKKAFYITGSKIKGTMTTVSKYAFKLKKDALKFQDKNGGIITNFDGAYKIAITDFAKDTGLVLAKRDTKMYKMGEKIYNKKCNKKLINKIDAHTMGNMKSIIKTSGACGDLNDKQLQAVMLFNWDKRLGNFEKLYGENKEIKKYAEKFKKRFEKMNK